ncbi:MAG: two-component regulator propeller domain-containing protein, partial [Bacteroidota bacterium]
MPRSPLARGVTLAALAVFVGGLPSRAQAPEREIRIDRLGVADGLAQTTVTAMVQDRHGFLWIGTEGGLDRYDGYRFVPFRHEPDSPGSLSSSFVTALAETPDGAIWVGTHGAGLNRLDPQTGVARRLRHAEADGRSISADRVTSLFVDRGGRLWAGTEAGLDRVDLATAQVTRVLEVEEVVDLAQGPDGDLWVASHEGLLRVSPSTGRILARWRADALGTDQTSAVWADDDGTVWIGTTDRGLFRLGAQTGTTEPFRPVPGAGGADIQDLLRDASGTLWIATGGGLARHDVRPPEADSWTVFLPSETDPGTLPSARLRTLAEDRAGLLWVGTWTTGLAKLRRTPFRQFSSDPGRAGTLSSSDIMGVVEDPRDDGVLWVGTYDAGLNRLDLATGTADQSRLPDALRRGSARSMVVDASGALWATSSEPQAVWRQDPETAAWTRVPFESSASVDRVISLAPA